jgi:hypothetical protein
MRAQFDKLAPAGRGYAMADTLAPVEAGLDGCRSPPRACSISARARARLRASSPSGFRRRRSSASTWRPQMIEEARRVTDSPRITYQVADAQKLPFADGAFDLVTLGNMIPFFDELARVVNRAGAC